jgi:ABC-type transport system involved in cytochrome c biogenesis permease subunit
MSRSDSNESNIRQKLLNLTMAGVAASVGCLTLVIVIAAVFAGLWLDARNGTRPWFTLGLVVLSIPISLAVMFVIVRLAISKIKAIPQKPKINPTEEIDIGK